MCAIITYKGFLMDMIDKIRYLYYSNHVQITWFFIGFFMLAGIHAFSVRDYTGMLVDWGLVALNYIFRK